jgi:hypothetical protein
MGQILRALTNREKVAYIWLQRSGCQLVMGRPNKLLRESLESLWRKVGIVLCEHIVFIYNFFLIFTTWKRWSNRKEGRICNPTVPAHINVGDNVQRRISNCFIGLNSNPVSTSSAIISRLAAGGVLQRPPPLTPCYCRTDELFNWIKKITSKNESKFIRLTKKLTNLTYFKL